MPCDPPTVRIVLQSRRFCPAFGLHEDARQQGATPWPATSLSAPLRSDAAEIRATAPSAPPDDMIGSYDLHEKIGEGGIGEVWVAEQRHPVRRTVAPKIIKRRMDTGQVIIRFEAELQALRLMDHPAIAKVLDSSATAQVSLRQACVTRVEAI